MLKRVKHNWKKMAEGLDGDPAYWRTNAGNIILIGEIKKALKRFGKGNLLDIGAGKLFYKKLILNYVDSYTSVDFKKTHPDLDYVADITKLPFADSSFDTLFCTQVLEHVPYPDRALRELYRVLKPGGYLILTVPHLAYLHNEPYDFYRYTKYSLKLLGEDAGFEVVEVTPCGGFLSFLSYVAATLILGLTYSIPLLGKSVFAVNQFKAPIIAKLDQAFDKNKLFAYGYLAVYKK